MTEVIATMPRAIERGLLLVRSLASCGVAQEPRFDASARQWIVSLWLRIEQAGEFVGTQTKWCVLIDETYPYGRVAFHPAAEGALTSTFPHQDRNTLDHEHRGWRHGKLCLDSPFRGEHRTTIVHDPVGDADARLPWHTERALAWLSAAAAGRLLAPGDPFECPSRPLQKQMEWAALGVVHDESARGFHAWDSHRGAIGTAKLGAIPGVEKALGVGAFVDENGMTIRRWEGRPLTAPDGAVSGICWLWPQPIVVAPWHAPGSWGELRRAGRSMGVDVDATLRRLMPSLRKGKSDTVLLLGYPIPMRMGSTPAEVHWDAVLLPRLAPAGGKPPDGFRPNARGWWQRDRTSHLRTRRLSFTCKPITGGRIVSKRADGYLQGFATRMSRCSVSVPWARLSQS